MGNTRRIADAISEGIGVSAVSIMDEPEITEYTDILFLGGAPYANIMAPELRAYAEALSADKIGKIVLFTTSNWSQRTVAALKKIFASKGIQVENEYFYAHMLSIEKKLEAAKEFGKKFAGNI
jgi:flavorubredoxin